MADEFDKMDMEDSMRATLREIEGGVEDTEYEEEVPEETPERSRDEKGRFVSKDPVVEDEPEIEDEPEDESEGIIVDETQVIHEPDASLTNPPTTLTAEAKSKWKELPDWAKREFHKREEDSRRGVDSLKADLEEKARFGSRMQEVVDPYRHIIQAEGGTPESAVQEMLNTAYILRQGHPHQKAQMTLQIAQQYGYINELVAFFRGNAQNQPHAPQYDPRVDQLERRLADKERAEQEAQAQSTQQVIDQFVSATNEDGSLQHPYFENVKHLMIPMLESGAVDTLEDAYEAAIWSHPDTRKVLEGQLLAGREQARQEEAKERARKAERANKVNLPKRGHHDSKPTKPTGSIDDTMRETMEKLRAG